MKFIKFIGTISIICLSFTACVDLNEELEDSIGREVLNEDINVAAKLLNGIYAPMLADFKYFVRPYLLYAQTISDDQYFTRSNFPDRIALDNFYWSPDDTHNNNMWEQAYASISLSNTFIDQYSEGATPEFINSSIGEAKFLRAYNYFNLVRYFGHVPLLLDSKLSEEEKLSLPQAPIEDVYNSIVQDLLDAQNLPVKWDETNTGRPRKASAMGMLAKVYLFMASPGVLNQSEYYSKAAELLKELELNAGELGVGLEPTVQEVYLRSAEYGPEMVFEIGYWGAVDRTPAVSNRLTGQSLPWVFEEYPLGRDRGWGWFVGEQELYDIFDDNDARKAVSFDTEWMVDMDGDGALNDTLHYTELKDVPSYFGDNVKVMNDTTPHCGKWRWPDNFESTGPMDDINLMIMRYADCLLMWSEAELEANGATADAYYGVNMVRQRANLEPLLGLGVDELRDAIRLERRRELCFEMGHRWFDLIRWGIQGEIPSLVAKGVGSKKYMPIPQTQINISGGSFQQNIDIP